MWYFGYLPEDMKYYSEFMNNIILDKYMINRLYKIQVNDRVESKRGILLINNFENILYTDSVNQNLILNILTDEMERNNYNVCTIIYGSKDGLTQILSKYPKLGKFLINLELETDELNIEKVNEILVNKLKMTEEIEKKKKKKLMNYIKSTYYQSENKNMEYVNKLESPYLGVYPDIGNLKNASLLYKVSVNEDMKLGKCHIFAAHLKETIPGKYREIPYGTGHSDFVDNIQELKKQGVRMFVGEFWYTGEENWKDIILQSNSFLREKLDYVFK